MSYKKIHRLPKSHRPPPCRESDSKVNETMYDCFEEFLEKDSGCALPWRLKENSTTLPVCSSPVNYQNFMQWYTDSDEAEVFGRTGCYFYCQYNVRFFTTRNILFVL